MPREPGWVGLEAYGHALDRVRRTLELAPGHDGRRDTQLGQTAQRSGRLAQLEQHRRVATDRESGIAEAAAAHRDLPGAPEVTPQHTLRKRLSQHRASSTDQAWHCIAKCFSAPLLTTISRGASTAA